MNINEIARRNDGNYVTEDGTTFVMHYLNPAYGESDDEPMYIKKEIPIDKNEGWVAEYQDAQHTWATADERETDERIDVSRVSVETGEDPMLVVLSLVADMKGNPEVALGIIDGEKESADKQKLIELLIKYKEQLNDDWQELLEKIYRDQKRISDICRDDLETKGITKTNQAYSKQHNKAIDKLKNCFEEAGYEVDRTPKRKRN